MCNCASAGSTPYTERITIANAGSDCGYTEEQMVSWKNLLFCVKYNQLYQEVSLTTAQVNADLGIIQSAINHKDNICYWQKQLDQIQPTIIKIINTQKCP